MSQARDRAAQENQLIDLTLVDKAQEGDPWAVGKLYETHICGVRKLLLSVLGPNVQLDDLAQEVFVQVFRSLKQFKGNSHFSTWLHRITVNIALSWLRQKKRTPQMVDDTAYPSRSATQENDAQLKSQLDELYRVFDSLSPKRRIAITLFEIEGYTLSEIAGITGSNIPTIKSRLFFARQDILKKAATRPILRELMNNKAGGTQK